MSDKLTGWKKEFAVIGQRWRENRRAVGDFLLRAEQGTGPMEYRALKKWIQREYGITIADLDVMRRVAAKEVPETLVGLIPATVLRVISVHNMPKPEKKYHIYSPETGAPVHRKLRDFSKQELRWNITKEGVLPPDAALARRTRSKTIKTASAYRVEGDTLILETETLEVQVRITGELVEQLGGVLKIA